MSLMNVPEDLSGMSRTDLVYKAKLAEQAERCVPRSPPRVCSLNKAAPASPAFRVGIPAPRAGSRSQRASWIVGARSATPRRGSRPGAADPAPATTPGRLRARRALAPVAPSARRLRVFFGSLLHGRATRTPEEDEG